ncbi:50S ribosomal protein L11 methyltransferase [Bartonella apis]|uniref:50S ribosomal protein L11 methyltransferase n=1 Tax=Bartonella apis TaxID=1686310 RepID=UPI00242BB34E|nr:MULTISPECIES: 50S ribosomal protein L11 methyltransferase [Bartonella]MCT6824894.1 50S ribosomal protein L11 methyltransferase [Bartonella apis]MCT6861081.1 50S ribosomal protein L11 methyltransferase [Bartonella apis]WLT09835.1 50S ribosomal protein L11 methyltransferase [Bartonella apihabitans]
MLGQIRLHYKSPKREAEKQYELLDHAFEDDAFPLAITEIDEANGIYEVSLYVDEAQKNSVLPRFAQVLGVNENKIEIEILPDIDWVSHSLEGLNPVRAGRFFVHGSHDRDKVKPGDLAIEIDAGQAFGTGHHGTTVGCLELIADVMEHEKPQNALDLGTGSGILAIGIALIKPIRILATDIDPIAIKVAKENFALNGVAKTITAITATGLDDEEIKKRSPFDLIVANILANPLIELAPQMVPALKKGGSIVLSGILEEQHDRVVKAFEAEGAKYIKTLHHEGWVAIHLK